MKINKQDIKLLSLYVIIAGSLAGVSHAIFNPEPTLARALGYGVFMGLILGTALFIVGKVQSSRKDK